MAKKWAVLFYISIIYALLATAYAVVVTDLSMLAS